MTFKRTVIPDVILFEPKVFSDNRGLFFESYNEREFVDATRQPFRFVQDNHSRSSRGVVRGMHYQLPPHAQGKLVRVLVGAIFDVALDIRRQSSTFGRWTGEVLSSDNKRQLWIPPGFAHGFLALSDQVEVAYKATEFYHPTSERCILWEDTELRIPWPIENISPILSDKDANGVPLRAAEVFEDWLF